MTAVAVAGPEGPATISWRQWRTPLIIIAIVLVAAVITGLLQHQPNPARGYLSPDGTGPTGTHALTDILAARGHPESTVTTSAAAVSAAVAGTTLVVTSPYLLSRADLRAISRTRANLVIAEPDQRTLRVLTSGVQLSGGTSVAPLSPSCSLRAADLAGVADLGGPGLRVAAGTPGAAECYPASGLPTLVQVRSSGRTVTLLSSGLLMANGYLAGQGNAALAINLLSAGGPVTWLIPPVPAATTGTGRGRSFVSLVPLAVWLIAAQLGLAALLAAAWRARRLGPLVAEPLPVVVRASETVEGHARLYRSRRARDRVAATLRASTTARLLPAIGLPPGSDRAATIAALAARSSLGSDAVAGILYGPPPASDTALVTLAADLDALDREVRSE